MKDQTVYVQKDNISNLQNQASGYLSKQAGQSQIIQNSNSIIGKNKKPDKQKRGRPKACESLNNLTNNQYRELKARKLANIQAYQSTLAKLRRQSKVFYSPFDKQLQLNIDKQKAIENLKQARDYQKNFRETVRSVGVRTQRNLFKYGVKEQLSFIIGYLQSGKLPRWMKQHFEELLQKDFSNPTCNKYQPPMI